VIKKAFFLALIFLIPMSSSPGDDSPYGINAHVGENPVLEKVTEAGIQWIRIDLYWNHIESEKGVFNFSEIDRIVDYSMANGLSILGVLSGSPGWSNGGKGVNYPSDHREDWEFFITRAVSRYKDRIRYWNIWNEPNVEKFYAPGKASFVEEVFLPAARIIREESPGSFIVGPELAHLEGQGSEWYFWMKYILVECAPFIDVVSHHIYKNTGVYAIFESLEMGENITPSVKEVVDDAGFSSAPFWITETGWDTELFTEAEQGDRYLKFLREMRERSFPDKIFFYQIIDDATPGIRPWGIVKSNFKEKPAYSIYRDFIAGRYPPVEDTEPEQLSKKCYMEDSVAKSGMADKRGFLGRLRYIRDRIRDIPMLKELVPLYYRWDPVLKQIAGMVPGFRKSSITAAVFLGSIFPALENPARTVTTKTRN